MLTLVFERFIGIDWFYLETSPKNKNNKFESKFDSSMKNINEILF